MLSKSPLLLAAGLFFAGVTGMVALGRPSPGYLIVPLELMPPLHSSGHVPVPGAPLVVLTLPASAETEGSVAAAAVVAAPVAPIAPVPASAPIPATPTIATIPRELPAPAVATPAGVPAETPTVAPAGNPSADVEAAPAPERRSLEAQVPAETNARTATVSPPLSQPAEVNRGRQKQDKPHRGASPASRGAAKQESKAIISLPGKQGGASSGH